MGDIYDKLGRMANAAAYDITDTGDNPERTLNCYEASASLQSTRSKRFRNPVENFIFRSKLPGGGSAPMLKVLMTDLCDFNCTYCAFRRDRDVPRDTIQPEELTRGFTELVRRGAVGGIFLSSGFYGGAAKTMDRILAAGEMIRRSGFDGYLHLKIMPGADDESIRRAIKLGSRVSINMEAPSAEHLKKIAPDKDYNRLIMDTFQRLHRIIKLGNKPKAGFTTQLVVGAAGESDSDILGSVNELYRGMGMARAYYSKLSPVGGTPLAHHPPTPRRRQGRLYQADWLLRQYGFTFDELAFEKSGDLPLDIDPKTAWARTVPELFPVEINTADREMLLRVPGIGHITAERVIKERRRGKIRSASAVRSIGMREAALSYITVDGSYVPVGGSDATQTKLDFG